MTVFRCVLVAAIGSQRTPNHLPSRWSKGKGKSKMVMMKKKKKKSNSSLSLSLVLSLVLLFIVATASVARADDFPCADGTTSCDPFAIFQDGGGSGGNSGGSGSCSFCYVTLDNEASCQPRMSWDQFPPSWWHGPMLPRHDDGYAGCVAHNFPRELQPGPGQEGPGLSYCTRTTSCSYVDGGDIGVSLQTPEHVKIRRIQEKIDGIDSFVKETHVIPAVQWDEFVAKVHYNIGGRMSLVGSFKQYEAYRHRLGEAGVEFKFGEVPVAPRRRPATLPLDSGKA